LHIKAQSGWRNESNRFTDSKSDLLLTTTVLGVILPVREEMLSITENAVYDAILEIDDPYRSVAVRRITRRMRSKTRLNQEAADSL
jgi:hypothetical protein